MSLLERVQELLKAKGLSIKQAERESGLSNATIRKWGTQNPSLDSIIKLADYLHVSIDYLAKGEDQKTVPRFEVYCDGVPLTELEADLVAMYRLLPTDDKKTVFDITKMKYEMMTGKKVSSFSTYSDTKRQEESGPDDDGKPCIGTA